LNGEEEIREIREMGYLETRDRIESDHPPVIAWMRREREGRMEKKGRYGMRGKGNF